MAQFTQVPSLIAPLDEQLRGIRAILKSIKDPEISGALLTGSCSTGKATYRSDIDILVLLAEGPLNYARTRSVRDRLEATFKDAGRLELLEKPLEVQFTVVLESVFATREPAMRAALRSAHLLSDAAGIQQKLKKLQKEAA
ncbi:MAG: nucleotidyltransferase domain-containing protein [Oligoflexia bacterium]|nr:nucleotidyltransferase domain-containing protein [Oligoflexia bacterium]